MLLSSFSEVKEYAAKIQDAELLAWDLETTGLDKWGRDKIIGIALHTEGAGAAYIPVGHGTGSFSVDSWEDVEALAWSKKAKRLWATEQAYRKIRPSVMAKNLQLSALGFLFEAMAQVPVWLAHNAQFDMAFWVKAGLPLPKTIVDTQILAHSLVSNWGPKSQKPGGFFMMPDNKKIEQGSESLKWLGRYFSLTELNANGVGEEASLATASNALYARLSAVKKHLVGIDPKKHMWALEAKDVAPYACQDVILTRGLYEALKVKLGAWGSWEFALSLCEVQRHVAFRMSKTGFALDVKTAALWASEGERLEAIAEGLPFNPNSPKQVKEWLQEQGEKPPNAQADTLRLLAKRRPDLAPTLQKALDYKALSSVISKYLSKWLLRDGVINPSYNMNGTETLRLSSSDDYVNNLQNIPRDPIAGIHPKLVLLPINPLWCIVEADYAAMEMYVGAWVAETLWGNGADMTLTEQLLTADMHCYTRDDVDIPGLILTDFYKKPTEVTIESILGFYESIGHTSKKGDWEEGEILEDYLIYCRAQAKGVNFSSIYGGGAPAIMKKLGVKRSLAEAIRDKFRDTYPAVREALYGMQKMALEPRPNPSGAGKFQYMQYPIFDFSRKYGHLQYRAKSKNGGGYSPREASARNALNSVVQGTGGLITLFSAMKLGKLFGDSVVHFHATTHDSITFSCHPDKLQEVLPVFRRLMCDWPIYPPLKVEFEVAPAGKGWGYKEGYEV